MTEEQKAQYEAFLQQQKAEQAKAQAKKMREDYKEMVCIAPAVVRPMLIMPAVPFAAFMSRAVSCSVSASSVPS